MPSAYVSRAPSPPPVFDTQLPVPEKSYLEVPNPTTSVHTSRSREIPPEPEAVDKGKRRESTTSGGGPSRSMSTSRHIPSGIEIPGPIALTDSNSSRRSGSGRLSETLNSVWGNTPPSAGPSASNSVLASPLEGPTSRSALLNALKPLASVPEGSAIPEVVHADPGADPAAQVYHNEPPKTPKAETPRPSASPSRIPVSASAAATSPKPAATPKAGSRMSVSPRTGGISRGLSVYSNGSQQPPADAAPPEPPVTMPEQGALHSEPQFVATPKGVSRAPTKPPTRSASPHPPAVAPEQEAGRGEPQNLGIPRSVSRVPSKPPTRSASPKPPVLTPEQDPISQSIGFAPSNIDAESYVLAAEGEPPAPPADTGPPAPAPAPAPEQSEPPAAATNVTEDDGFMAPVKRGSSKKGGKGSKLGSKVPTPKGSQTPKQSEPTANVWGQSASVDVSVADAPRSLSAAQSPLATVPEHSVPEVVPSQGNATPAEAPLEGQSAVPGGFFVANPDEAVTTPPEPTPEPTQNETTSFSGFGSLGGGMGGMIGAATSTFGSLGWGLSSKKDKSKPSTPGSTTPAGWGGGFGAGVATSAAESTGGAVGWGPATGNSSRSNSAWFDKTAKSVNASTADLLSGGGSNAEHMLELDNIPAAENQLPDPPVEPPAETGEAAFQMIGGEEAFQGGFGGEGGFQGEFGGEGATQEETQGAWASAEETHHARDPLTLNTDVPAEPGAATAAPTTAGESPDGGEGGGDGDGEGEGGAKATEEDEWAIPVKTKKKKGGGGGGGGNAAGTAPVTPGAGGAATEEWATTTKKKKKGKGK